MWKLGTKSLQEIFLKKNKIIQGQPYLYDYFKYKWIQLCIQKTEAGRIDYNTWSKYILSEVQRKNRLKMKRWKSIFHENNKQDRAKVANCIQTN